MRTIIINGILGGLLGAGLAIKGIYVNSYEFWLANFWMVCLIINNRIR